MHAQEMSLPLLGRKEDAAEMLQATADEVFVKTLLNDRDQFPQLRNPQPPVPTTQLRSRDAGFDSLGGRTTERRSPTSVGECNWAMSASAMCGQSHSEVSAAISHERPLAPQQKLGDLHASNRGTTHA